MAVGGDDATGKLDANVADDVVGVVDGCDRRIENGFDAIDGDVLSGAAAAFPFGDDEYGKCCFCIE